MICLFTTDQVLIKILFKSIIFLITSLQSPAQVKNSDAIVGKWMSVENNLKVEVYKDKNAFKAKILWFDDSDDRTKPLNERTDEKNPNRSLRTRKLIGMEVLDNLKYDEGDDEWEYGQIYDSKTGKYWSSVVWLTKDNLLKVKGYWLFKFLSETITFKRV